MTSNNSQPAKLGRRKYLAGIAGGLTALSGCSTITGLTEEHDPINRDPPVYVPKNETSDQPDWEGGYESAKNHGAAIYGDGVKISVVFLRAASQLGIYYGDPVDGNPEQIENREFEWVKARDEAFFFVPYVEIRGEDSDYRQEPEDLSEAVPTENWTATADINDEESPEVLPLSYGLDDTPTYYRLRASGASSTSVAYPTSVQHGSDLRVLAFEIADPWVYVIYDGGIRAEWAFDVY